ncbi:MAG: sigma-70 family RNA polymerase sigma factor [Ruminococcus sp.]|nr:sigma-70 family RNA polymerase sigma factor [Ruminococcus sp.]
MENYFKKIKMEDVNEIIKKNGFYYIPTEVLYTDFVGPKYIVATDDPQFKQKHPELAGMIIVSVAMFAEMAKEYNRYFANEVREKRRQSRYHIDEGYYEDCEEDENGNCPNLKIKDLPLNPVQDEVEKRLDYEELHKAINLLNEVQRKRVMMYFFEGKSQQEIADIQGVRLYTVQKSIEAAKNFLKNFLKQGGEKPSPSSL